MELMGVPMLVGIPQSPNFCALLDLLTSVINNNALATISMDLMCFIPLLFFSLAVSPLREKQVKNGGQSWAFGTSREATIKMILFIVVRMVILLSICFKFVLNDAQRSPYQTIAVTSALKVVMWNRTVNSLL
jgi:hypothetical protein